ncbi:hypothetical protein COLO4_19137 [Corchorus olitorius]|uniref:RNase H type-1 domain-containing protein n=1 Tax=Corchorus olitorius TaxID=93759 RepID=A0A1R3J6I3_9ROSI|nr:hypothetical protein COLO4_19137 [Corchorus olitorius]
MTERLKIDSLKVYIDSQLVAKQVLGEYEVNEPNLVAYHKKVQEMWPKFIKVTIQQVPRKENRRADAFFEVGIR